MGCINTVALSGNLVRNPELRATNSGSYLASFAIAVNEGTKEQQRVSYFDCVKFLGQQPSAALQNFWAGLPKGQKVTVKGKLRQDRWEHDGEKRSKVEVIVDELDTLGRAAVSAEDFSQGQQIPLAAAPPQYPSPAEMYDEPIPF